MTESARKTHLTMRLKMLQPLTDNRNDPAFIVHSFLSSFQLVLSFSTSLFHTEACAVIGFQSPSIVSTYCRAHPESGALLKTRLSITAGLSTPPTHSDERSGAAYPFISIPSICSRITAAPCLPVQFMIAGSSRSPSRRNRLNLWGNSNTSEEFE